MQIKSVSGFSFSIVSDIHRYFNKLWLYGYYIIAHENVILPGCILSCPLNKIEGTSPKAIYQIED